MSLHIHPHGFQGGTNTTTNKRKTSPSTNSCLPEHCPVSRASPGRRANDDQAMHADDDQTGHGQYRTLASGTASGINPEILQQQQPQPQQEQQQGPGAARHMSPEVMPDAYTTTSSAARAYQPQHHFQTQTQPQSQSQY